jgi:hypothetical protein
MGTLLKFDLYRFLVYSGFGLYGFLVYSGFVLDRFQCTSHRILINKPGTAGGAKSVATRCSLDCRSNSTTVSLMGSLLFVIF